MSLPGRVTHVEESAVIPAPIDRVWGLVGSLQFSWWGLVAGAEGEFGRVPGTITLTFKDKTVAEYRILEISAERKRVVIELITCTPPPQGTAAVLHTLRLISVTATNETLVQWSTDFSADVTLEALVDSKHKKLEAFRDLAKAVA